MTFELSPPKRRAPRENFVPMINVVFLLLIFFLMTAQIAPPEPFEVTPPDSAQDTPAGSGTTLFVSAKGDLALKALRDEAGILAHLQSQEPGSELILRADARVAGETIAALMPKLAAAGVTRLKLISSHR